MYTGLLNDNAIRELCLGRNEMISPYHQVSRKFGTLSYGQSYMGYDVRISDKMSYLKSEQTLNPEFLNVEYKPAMVVDDSHALIEPGEVIFAGTIEYFKMPTDVLGLVKDKSTLARCGLAVQNTVLEPGWEGYLTVEISNHGPCDVILTPGMPIAQILFWRGEAPSKFYQGKYQGQGQGQGAI